MLNPNSDPHSNLRHYGEEIRERTGNGLAAVADVARRSLERGRDQATALERRAAASMSRNPWKTASIGAAAGLLVGLIAALRASRNGG